MSIINFQDLPAHNPVRHAIGICLALLIFVLLWVSVTQYPIVSRWDSSFSQWTQQLRGPVTDPVMLSLTMLGDTRLATLLVALVVIGLLRVHRFWLSVHLVCVGLSALLSVPILKVLIERARPVMADGALQSLSFPSGHACTAALIAGLLALLLAYRKHSITRYAIYAVAALLALLIAFSRIYLLAHWPSDVIAGLALGYALIVAFGWQLHTADALNYRYQRSLLVASGLIMSGYVLLSFSTQAPRYGLG